MQTKNIDFLLRAAGRSYLLLCSIWLILSSGYFWLGTHRGLSNGVDIALFCISISAVIIGWLRGFKITVTDTHFEYRGGNYITTRIPLAEIGRLAFTWVEWERTGGTVKIPRLAVITRDRRVAAVINSQPFRLKELHGLTQRLEHLDGYDPKLKAKGAVKMPAWRMELDFICVAVTVLSVWGVFMGILHLIKTCGIVDLL